MRDPRSELMRLRMPETSPRRPLPALMRLGALLGSAIAVTSCVVGPNYHEPDAHVPATFDAASRSTAARDVASNGNATANVAIPSVGNTTANLDLASWWHALND